MEKDIPASRHFALQMLRDGVYAAIAADGGWAICNAGIVDLGDRAIVFDTFVNQNAAAELRDAALRLTGKPVDYVINSHYHSDHVKGNQAFAGAKVVSTTQTREMMMKAKVRYDNDVERLRKDVQQDLESHLANPGDPDSILFEGYDRGHLDGLPTLRYTLSDVTFDRGMKFHGSKRTAEAVTYGGGHTASDAILYLPDEKVVFMGDLLFVACHPYLADGNLEALYRSLERRWTRRFSCPGTDPSGPPLTSQRCASTSRASGRR